MNGEENTSLSLSLKAEGLSEVEGYSDKEAAAFRLRRVTYSREIPGDSLRSSAPGGQALGAFC